MSDFNNYMSAQAETRRWIAERENASARLELAGIRERCAMLLSQHQPVQKMDLSREKLRLVFAFLNHGDVHRLDREIDLQAGAQQ